MAYAVVRTDKMFGTDNRAGLVSIKYLPSATPTAIENGNVVKVGALIDGEREVYAGATPAANTPINEIVLIATPEIMYEEHKRSLADYINPADKICRGFRLHSGDIFSVTADALAFATNEATDGKVGSAVELKADTKLQVAVSATNGSTAVGKIVAIETAGSFTYYVIQVD